MPKYLIQAGPKKQCKKQMRLCVTKFSPTGFSASKGFQRNLIFCSNEATICVFWALAIKSKKHGRKIIEKNQVRKDLSMLFSPCSAESRGRIASSFLLSSEDIMISMRQALRQCPAPGTLPCSQLLGHSLLLQPLTATDSLSLPIPYGWNLYLLPVWK